MRVLQFVSCLLILTQQAKLLELNLPISIAINVIVERMNFLIGQLYLQLFNAKLEIRESQIPFLYTLVSIPI